MVLEGQTIFLTSVAISADGIKIVSGSVDKNVCVWNSETGQVCAVFLSPASTLSCVVQLLQVLEGHTDAVFAVAISADGTTILSGGGDRDKTVRIWRAETGKVPTLTTFISIR